MKSSNPLFYDHGAHGHPAQNGACSNPASEWDAVSLSDQAQRCARELMASLSLEREGKTMPVGAGEGTEALAALLRSRFGTMAPTVAAWCAFLAWSEGADAGYGMWTDTFKRVRPAG